MSELIKIDDDSISTKIYVIRDEKVMIDRDLASLYGVETRVLNQAVRRNITRFPEDFMFQLSEKEVDDMVSQFVIPSKSYFGGAKPLAFTEQGVAMLSSVLKSETAIKVNINIIRVFTKLRKLIASHSELVQQIEFLKENFSQHEQKIELIFDFLNRLQTEKTEEEDFQNREKIGYKK